jgi:hypothetical protein
MLGFARLRGDMYRKAGKEPTAMHARRTLRRDSSSWIQVRKMVLVQWGQRGNKIR